MNIKCIIVDDEELAREGLLFLLSEREGVEVIRSCGDGLSAISAIEQLKPDLVFLDVQMPGINGFEVIASIPGPKPYVIFATAHDQYAIKAFEINAIDYLLKPFSDERFDQALEKAIGSIKRDQLQENLALDQLIKHTRESVKSTTQLLSGTSEEKRLIFKADGQVYRIPFDDISHIEAYDYYIKIHVKENFFLIRETMKKMQEKLAQNSFMRIHKSFIVNTRQVRQFGKSPEDHHVVTLVSGTQLKVSRSYKNQLQEALK